LTLEIVSGMHGWHAILAKLESVRKELRRVNMYVEFNLKTFIHL